MKISFFPRVLAFTFSFWCGIVVTLFVLSIINVVCFFHGHFWIWFISKIRYVLFPVASVELLRSPIMGLLFALLGTRNLSQSDTIRFGAVCGAASYAVADAFNLAGFAPWSLGPYFRQPVAEYIILGLPIVLILLSRFSFRSQTQLAR